MPTQGLKISGDTLEIAKCPAKSNPHTDGPITTPSIPFQIENTCLCVVNVGILIATAKTWSLNFNTSGRLRKKLQVLRNKMGTSGGEPRTLLNALKPMLGYSGDIRTSQEVVRIVSLMRDAEKLMSRCVYLNILKATIAMATENNESTETLEKFVICGGWAILNRWLSDAKKSDNFLIVVELLEILKDLPVSVDTLKQGNIGKIVKTLTKADQQEVKNLSTSILKRWMHLVRNQSGTVPEKSEKSSKQNGDSLETASISSDSSVDVTGKDFKQGNGEVKLGKRIREGDPKKSPSEKKLKSEEASKAAKAKKEASKVVAVESAGFMNALATAAVPVPRKRKRSNATTAQKTSTTTTTTTASAPTTATATKPSYTGILDEIMSNQSQTHGIETGKDKVKNKEKDNSATQEKTSEETKPEAAAASGDAGDFVGKDADGQEKENSQESNTASSTPSTATEDTSESSEPTVRKPNKKGRVVTWVDDSKLATFHYFEMDEDERAHVHHPVNFLNAAHLEMMKERELLEKAKRMNEDKMSEKVKWYRPKPIKGLQEPAEPGSKSEQKNIQKEREASVLADIFFSKSSVPDSPAEPEIESSSEKVSGEPKVIPHDEKGTTHIPAKEPTATPASQSAVQLPAPLASLFSSGGGTQPAQQSDPVSVQSLLDKIMSGGSSGQPNPIMKLLSNVQQQQPPQAAQEQPGANLPPALKNILEPLHSRVAMGGPRPQMGPMGPNEPQGPRAPMGPPGPFGPRAPGPDFRPRFQGPGGPRQGPPMGPPFPGPEGPGARMRGPGPGPRMPQGPRPLLPELSNREDFHDEMMDDDGEEDERNGPPMRGRGRGSPRGRGRGRGRRNPPPICRHFVSNRGCLRGELCHFLHPGVNGPPV